MFGYKYQKTAKKKRLSQPEVRKSKMYNKLLVNFFTTDTSDSEVEEYDPETGLRVSKIDQTVNISVKYSIQGKKIRCNHFVVCAQKGLLMKVLYSNTHRDREVSQTI